MSSDHVLDIHTCTCVRLNDAHLYVIIARHACYKLVPTNPLFTCITDIFITSSAAIKLLKCICIQCNLLNREQCSIYVSILLTTCSNHVTASWVCFPFRGSRPKSLSLEKRNESFSFSESASPNNQAVISSVYLTSCVQVRSRIAFSP